MDEQKRCQESIWNGFRSRPCGRPVKGDGELCGIHAAAKQRREANDAKRKVQQAEYTAAWRRCRELAKTLAALGVEVSPSGKALTIDADTAEALVERLRRLETDAEGESSDG